MSYPPAANTAKTYSLIAVILSFMAAAVWLIVSLILVRLSSIFLVMGILAVVIAVLIYITTYDRIRIGDFEGAKGPCLMWGFLGLILGGVIVGLFLILAHSKLSEISQHAPAMGAPQYRPPSVPRTGGAICFGCGSVIPATATSCPRCGKPR
jgi:hypothetical protein